MADFCLHVISSIFYCKILAPIGLHKKTLPLVGWSQKYLSSNYCDFLTPTDAVTQKINTNILPLRNITNPTCRDSVKMCYRHRPLIYCSCDGVHWGTVKDTATKEYIRMDRLIPILTHLSSHWTVPLKGQ